MSSLIGVLQKSGGQVRTVTSQAALIKSSNSVVWEKGAELSNKVQKKYDEDYQKILFLKSSLHELYKIEPIKTRFAKIWYPVFYHFAQNIKPLMSDVNHSGNMQIFSFIREFYWLSW